MGFQELGLDEECIMLGFASCARLSSSERWIAVVDVVFAAFSSLLASEWTSTGKHEANNFSGTVLPCQQSCCLDDEVEDKSVWARQVFFWDMFTHLRLGQGGFYSSCQIFSPLPERRIHLNAWGLSAFTDISIFWLQKIEYNFSF